VQQNCAGKAREVMKTEFPELAAIIALHILGEKTAASAKP
jgi:hypothetical protein